MIVAEQPARYFTRDREILDRIAAIREGMPVADLANLATRTGLPISALAESLRLNTRTLRRRTDRLNAEETEKFLRVTRVLDRAEELMDPEAARQWLTEPAIALGRRTPISLLDTDLGTAQVFTVLGAIDWCMGV